MIRFRCPACDKTLKTAPTSAGKTITCPRCRERVLVPGSLPDTPIESPPEEPRQGFLASMGPRLRVFACGAAALSVLGVLPALLGGPAWLAHGGVVAAGLGLLSLLTALHGHATGCPRCGGWWTRTRAGSEVADRELVLRGGTAFGKSGTRTNFRCAKCRHTWSVRDAEKYRVPDRKPAQRVGP